MRGPILFQTSSFERLANEIAAACPNLQRGSYETTCFLNGERYVTLSTTVERAPCIVLGTIAPPAEQFLETLLLTDTLHRYGAASVELLLPYFAYSRHDKGGGGRSIAFPLMKRLIGVAGVSRIITIDLHAPTVALGDGPPIVSLDPSPLFARALAPYRPESVSFVAPDRGALRRADAVRRASRNENLLIEADKHRTAGGVQTVLRGKPTPTCIIIDDILDTGGTLLEVVDQLTRAGATRFIICASHGLFTERRWEELWSRGVERIYTLDTIGDPPPPPDPRITVLSCAHLLSREFERYAASKQREGEARRDVGGVAS
jgi:ribose-phosphate pyrophosphokinase